jgi:hypothetical protein
MYLLLPIFAVFIIYSIYVLHSQSPYNLRENDPLASKKNLLACQMPPTTQQHAWDSKVFLCPYSNGSYAQCTNNYVPTYEKENCDPMNRTFEMCPTPYQISECCYYNKTPMTPKDAANPQVNPYKPTHYEPVMNPDPENQVRINMFFTPLEKKLLLKTPCDIPPPIARGPECQAPLTDPRRIHIDSANVPLPINVNTSDHDQELHVQ